VLPGCHVIDLERQMPANAFGLSSGVYFSGQLNATTYALRMKAGARYIIRRDISSDGQVARVDLSAREELPNNGPVTDLSPVKSPDEISACKAWTPGAGK
jgi:hypothetical protein